MGRHMDTERYCELVRTAGIEAAYEQRFRATGRTTRAALKTALLLSEGENLCLDCGNHAEKRHFMEKVRDILGTLGVLDLNTANCIRCVGGGWLTIADINTRHGLRDYQLVQEI